MVIPEILWGCLPGRRQFFAKRFCLRLVLPPPTFCQGVATQAEADPDNRRTKDAGLRAAIWTAAGGTGETEQAISIASAALSGANSRNHFEYTCGFDACNSSILDDAALTNRNTENP